MKRRAVWLLLSGVLLAAAVGFFSWHHQQYSAPMPEPSAWGGYYADDFVLKLTVPGKGNIYYTTDGSAPTLDSAVYDGGISLRDRTEEPNVYNADPRVVADWQDFTPDSDPVPKGTVVRAMFVNERGISSEVLTQTYFVGIQPPEKGYTLSLIFEDEALFGEDGIHVTGKAYDAWYLGESEEEAQPNFQQHLEAPVIGELMDEQGDVMNQPLGLRIQGASTRGAAKKRLILFSREEYSGNPNFEAAVFEGAVSHSAMVKDCLPDAIAADFVSDRAVAVQRSVPVRVYLNGEFWYESFLLERYDEQYFRQYYQVNDRILVKNGATDEESAAKQEMDYYGEFLCWIEEADFSDSQQWEQLQKEADVQSYIDYLVTNYFFCNFDFHDRKNYVLWRSHYPEGTEYGDTRWRWCLYDLDVLDWIRTDPTKGNPVEIDIFTNDVSHHMNETALYRALRRSPAFNRQFVLSFMDMYNNNFSPDHAGKVLAKYGETLDWMDGYFRKRPQYAAEHLAREFSLTGKLETVTITTDQPQMGSVKVNTSVIDLTDGSWSGQYFTDYPITVTAEAKPGYRFVGWEGASETGNLSVEGGVHLKAIFAPQ